MATFTSVENARALVTLDELAQIKKKVYKVVLHSLNKKCAKDAEAIEGEEVMTLRPEQQGTKQFFVNTSKIPRETRRPPLTGGAVPSGFVPVDQRRGVRQ